MARRMEVKVLCDSCGNDAAYRLSFSEYGVCCDRCGRLGNASQPDVFFNGPYRDPHLIDPCNRDEIKNGRLITSKREKAEIMKKLGVHEVGDRRGGMRLEDKFMQRLEKEKGR